MLAHVAMPVFRQKQEREAGKAMAMEIPEGDIETMNTFFTKRGEVQ